MLRGRSWWRGGRFTPPDGGGGTWNAGAIADAKDARAALEDAFSVFPNCTKLFGGTSKVVTYAKGLTFLDGRRFGNLNAAGGPFNESFAQYHTEYPSEWASTLWGPNNRMSKTVVLWTGFFGNVAGGYPTPRIDQQVTLVHEFLHSYYNFVRTDHSDFVTKFGIRVQRNETNTQAIDRWIEHNCKN